MADPLPSGWEAVELKAAGFPQTVVNEQFLDYWHGLEGCGNPGHGALNATCQGGTGGFLGSIKAPAPWFNDDNVGGGLWIAGFKNLDYAGMDWGAEVHKNTPDLIGFLMGTGGNADAAAQEMQARGTSHASASDISSIFSGEKPGAGGGGGTGPPVLPKGCPTDPNCGLPSALMQQFQKSGDPTGALGDCTSVSIGLGWSNACASACCETALGANAGGGVNVGPKTPDCSIGGIISLPSFFCDFFSAITSEAFWIRAGEVLLGIILLIVGLVLLGKKFTGGGVGGQVGKVARGVAPSVAA